MFDCGSVEVGAVDLRLLTGIITAVMRSKIHRCIRKCDGRHKAVDTIVREVHQALPNAALNGHCLCDANIGSHGFGDLERVKVRAADGVASVPIEADKLVASHERGAIVRGFAQARNEIDR